MLDTHTYFSLIGKTNASSQVLRPKIHLHYLSLVLPYLAYSVRGGTKHPDINHCSIPGRRLGKCFPECGRRKSCRCVYTKRDPSTYDVIHDNSLRWPCARSFARRFHQRVYYMVRSSPTVCIPNLTSFRSIFLVFSGIFTFLVDAYPNYAASALAANTFLRCIFAASFPLFGEQSKFPTQEDLAIFKN